MTSDVNDTERTSDPCSTGASGSDASVNVATADLKDSFALLSNELRRVGALLTSQPSALIVRRVDLLRQKLQRVNTANQATDVLLGVLASVSSRVRAGGVIKVQPTAIARRREGTVRGAKRVASGRPTNDVGSSRPKKRRRNLAQSVLLNIANAKSHGTGH